MTVRTGQTPSGVRFEVPVTPDMFITLLNPFRWGPAELLTLALLFTTGLGVLLRRVLPIPIYVAVFLFWRLAYNVGLGLVLRAQSRRRSFSKAVSTASPSAKTLLNWFATGSMPRGFAWSKCPLEFNAWLTFRALSIIVLSNDGCSYIALAIACFRPMRDFSPIALFFCFTIGVALIAFSLWAKAAAHDCLGDFAWYWGDFFFTVDNDLVFDGVFQLFPHPMYTVGYAAYYGASLITRSHILFTVSILAHACQILFLVFVEEPHIQLLYGPKPKANGTGAGGNAEDEEEEITPAPPSIFARIALMFSSAYFALTTVVVTVVILFLLTRPSLSVVITLFLLWRAIHWCGLGYILSRQATRQLWTKHFVRSGYTTRIAYDNWRHIWTLSYTLNHVLFVWLAFSLRPAPDANWLLFPSPRAASRITGSAALILIALFAEWSAYSAIGDFGFNYGDFFLSPKRDVPLYTGVFRYLNNPEAALGYLAYYGLAFWRQSWLLLFFAAVSQALHLAFVRHIETPHMRRKYNEVRPSSEITRAAVLQGVRLVAAVPFLGTVGNGIRRSASRSTTALYNRAARQGAVVRDSLARSHLRAVSSLDGQLRNHKLVGKASKLSEGVVAKISSLDSDEIMSKLQKIGLTIKPIADANGNFDDAGALQSSKTE